MTSHRLGSSALALAGVAVLVACASPRPKPAVVAPPPPLTRAPAAAPLPPLTPSLVAASNELAEALRAPGPLRSQRIARARSAIESIVGRRAAIVGPKKLGHGLCALAPTNLAVGASNGVTPTRSGHFVDVGDRLLRFDPELTETAPAAPQTGGDDPQGIDSARFAWIRGKIDRLVDLETNAVVARIEDQPVLFRTRNGRLRLIGMIDDATELRSLPSGKLLFRHERAVPFADDVAGVAGAVGLPFGTVPPWIVVHDAEDGREIRRFADVPSSAWGTRSVAVARDGRALALNAVGSLAWLEMKGRRVVRTVSGGSLFEGAADGPFFTADGKRACAEFHGVPIVLPVDVPPSSQHVCAFSRPTALHQEVVIVTVKPDPPWQILRGRANMIGNFPRTLGASAGSLDGRRAAVVETAKPVDGWRGEGRLRLVDAQSGATVRTWPIGERGLIDLHLEFVDGDSALVLEGSEDPPDRFEIDRGVTAARPATPPPSDEEPTCAAPTAWDPAKEPTCVVGPVLGPAALCEGLEERSAQQRNPVE